MRASIAAVRSIEPKELGKLLKSELDWVVMKSLEKDRTRRYESASAIVNDLQRYLRDEPVEACPPSAIYQARKFIRRHRWPVMATHYSSSASLESLARRWAFCAQKPTQTCGTGQARGG